MVIDHADGLHEGVTDGGADEAEAALLEVLAEGIRFRCGGRDLRHRLKAVRLRLPVVAVNTFKDGLMLGEHLYYDLVTLCEQGGLALDEVLKATAPLRATTAATM